MERRKEGAEPNKIGGVRTKVPLPGQELQEFSSRCTSLRECKGERAHICRRCPAQSGRT